MYNSDRRWCATNNTYRSKKNRIEDDECLESNCIISNNGQHRACQQDDGNFVLYKKDNSAVWENNKDGTRPSRMCMKDGRLVAYTGDRIYFSAGEPQSDEKRPYHTIIQDDGNLVTYNKNNGVVWSTNTCPTCRGHHTDAGNP